MSIPNTSAFAGCCRYCGAEADAGRWRLCSHCATAVELHRATVAAEPDRPLNDEAALGRYIVQRQRSWAGANPSPDWYSLDLSVTVVEIESGSGPSAFMLFDSDGFRRYGQALIDLAEHSIDFDAAHFTIHRGLDLFVNQRGPAGRHVYRGLVLAPAAVATWVGNAGRGTCAVRVVHKQGAHPSEAIGAEAWQRLRSAIGACGIDLDPVGRALRFEHGPAPEYEAEGAHAHPADLAVVVALLIDAGAVDPAICEDAGLCAQIGPDGSLIAHPMGRSGLAHWATQGAWTRLILSDLDATHLSDTGLALYGYEHLAGLIRAWRTGRGITVEPGAAA